MKEKEKKRKRKKNYYDVMSLENPSFNSLVGLIKHYPKKAKEITEKILALNPNAKEFAILYNKIRNSELKNRIYEAFHTYVTRRSDSHIGNNEDFFFLVNSVIIENRNPFYTDVNVRDFIDNILLQWQRSPCSYRTLDYLFEILFGGWGLKFYKEMAKKPELYNTPLIFTEANIRGIFRNASFGLVFQGRTPEARESLRKYYLVEIFGKLVDCAKKITLQIGNSDCCDEIEKESLEQISLVKKYADLLYTIGAIDKNVRQKRHLELETKKKEIVNNGKKWRQKATKGVAFSTIKKLFFC